MNTFVQKLSRAYSEMKLHLRETRRIQERMKIETTAEMPYFTVEIQSSFLVCQRKP